MFRHEINTLNLIKFISGTYKILRYRIPTRYSSGKVYTNKAHFTPLKESLQNLLEMGVPVYACPACMKAAGIEVSDLLDGIKVAEKERFVDFTEGRIITINYLTSHLRA